MTLVFPLGLTNPEFHRFSKVFVLTPGILLTSNDPFVRETLTNSERVTDFRQRKDFL